MAAKKGRVEKALRKAQSVIASYVKPGRKSAEATIDELLKVLGKARGVLRAVPGGRRKRRTTRGRRAAAGRAAAARRSSGATKRKATARRRKARSVR